MSDLDIFENEEKKIVFDNIEKYKNKSEKSLREDNFIVANKNEVYSVHNITDCSLLSVVKL